MKLWNKKTEKNVAKKAGKNKSAKRKSKRFEGLKKYRPIIISIVLFLTFDISILALNYYQSFKVASSAVEINIASRQASLIQDIAKSLTDINLISERDFNVGGFINITEMKKEVFKQFDALEESSRLFSQSLHALKNGGDISGLSGDTVSIDAITIPKATTSLGKITDIWTPYEGLINSFITQYRKNDVSINNIEFAADYARIYTNRLLLESNDIAAVLQMQAEKQANILKWIQIIGIIIAISIFFYIVFRALGELLQADFQLAKSRRETTEIMDTIQEGLFLIDNQFIIGEQQSQKLSSIFPVANISGRKFDDVLKGVVSEKDIVNTQRFIKQLFNRKVRENLINDLNPLRRVFIRQEKTGGGGFQESYLRFHFARSYDGKEINHILVSITDITEAVELEIRLQKEREQSEMYLEMLMQLLRIDTHSLDSFMRNSAKMTEQINMILRRSGSTQIALKNKVNEIFREVHGFKGEASALELESFVDIAESMEEKLKLLQTKSQLTGNDFLSITMELNRFFTLNQDIEEMRQRLLHMNVSKNGEAAKGSGRAKLSHYFQQFAKQVADRNNKIIHLDINGFDDLNLPEKTIDTIKTITVQLLRNAIVHGIETPNTRIAAGKKEVGNIKLNLDLLNNPDGNNGNPQWQLLIVDDGGGIRFDALREKLIQAGHYSAEQAEKLTQRELYRALFLSGLSTQDESNEDAGRGVGMDVVKDRIQQLKGKIDIRSQAGQSCQFLIRFPA